MTKKGNGGGLLGIPKGKSYLQKGEHRERKGGERAWTCSNNEVGTWILNREGTDFAFGARNWGGDQALY